MYYLFRSILLIVEAFFDFFLPPLPPEGISFDFRFLLVVFVPFFDEAPDEEVAFETATVAAGIGTMVAAISGVGKLRFTSVIILNIID